MATEYRYFLISSATDQLIYGECIEWEMTEFDKPYTNFHEEKISANYSLYMVGSSLKIHTIQSAEKKIYFDFQNKQIEQIRLEFTYEDESSEFISKKDDELLFNPLTDLCTKSDIYFTKNARHEQLYEWIDIDREAINTIKDCINVDLKSHNELINTFSEYVPYRILIDAEFVDKMTRPADVAPSQMKITVIDELNKYQNCNVAVNCWNNQAIVNKFTFKVSEKSKEFTVSPFPDKVELIVENNGQIIVWKKYGFIKSIRISSTVSVGSLLLPSGDKIELTHKSNFTVGD